MSSTILSGKASAAFKREDGSIVYFLFEKTHESNVFPQKPNWSCIAIGNFKEVMYKVFHHSTACEGGCLVGTGRRLIKPENYISDWRRKLTEPVQIGDCKIRLTVGNSYLCHIDMHNINKVEDALKNIGREDFFETIKTGNASVSLHQDIEIILALYGVGQVFPPWRIVEHYMTWCNPQPEYAPMSSAGKVNNVNLHVYQVDDYTLLYRNDDSKPWKFEYSYQIINKFICDYAYENEMQQTGSSKRMIADYRNLCLSAPKLPKETKFTVTRITDGDKTYDRDCVDQLAQELGLVERTTCTICFQFVFW